MKKDARAAVGLAAVVFAVFSFAPPARFLQWDDAANLVDNDKWRGLSWDHLRWMWTTRHYGPWQPLSWLSWALDFKLWGLDAAAFRRTNVLLHSLAAGLFFLACRRRLTLQAAAGAALFFALHPLRVESVVWITERRDVLSGFFAVLSIHLWLEERRRWSLLAFAGAALSKGTAVAVLPFLFVLDRRNAAKMLPHAAVGLLAGLMNLGGFRTGDLHGLDLPLAERALTALSGAWFYLSKTLLPVGLSPYYELRPGSHPGAWAALLATAACFHRKVRSWAAPAWLAYLAALAPVSGLLQNGRQAAADRYSYLACMPFALLSGFALQRLAARRPKAAEAALAGAAVLLAVLTVRQAGFWRDDVSLWSRAAAIEPDAYLPNSNLSVALLVAGRGEDAIPHLEKAAALEPRDAEARVNLASVLAAKGDDARAIALFQEAVALRPGDPSFASARYNLGLLLVRHGRKSDGLAEMREAVRLNPALPGR